MSKKRSKMLIAMAVLVLVGFLLIQIIIQKTRLIPQLPTSIISESIGLMDSEKGPIAVETNEDAKKPPLSVPSKLVQSQSDDNLPVHSEDTSSVQQSEQSTMIIDHLNVSQILKNDFIDEQQQQQPTKSDETNSTPEETKVIVDNRPEPEVIESSEPAKAPEQSNKEHKITLWTPFFQKQDYIDENDWKSNCPHTNCRFTSDRDSYHQSDALLFHQADTNPSDLPESPRDPRQRWIYLNHESPAHTDLHLLSAINGQINWTATYRLDSDFLLSPTFSPAPSVLPETPINHFRPGMVAWLVSNCKTAGNRESFVDELKKQIQVDVYGACGNLTCLPKMSNECYETLSRKYFFYLSFENSLCPDYVTEKFFSIMSYPIVPIVFGGADYSRLAPPNSYIDALSFESPAKLAEYLIHLTQTPEEYDVYFNWKRYYLQTYTHYACRICSALNQPEQSTKRVTNLSQWWFEEAPCKRWINGKLVLWKSA